MNSLFDEKGRRIPFEGMRVFNKTSNWYYQIKQPTINFEKILQRTKQHSDIKTKLSGSQFEKLANELKRQIEMNKDLQNLFGGVHVLTTNAQKKVQKILERSSKKLYYLQWRVRSPVNNQTYIVKQSSKVAQNWQVN